MASATSCAVQNSVWLCTPQEMCALGGEDIGSDRLSTALLVADAESKCDETTSTKTVFPVVLILLTQHVR